MRDSTSTSPLASPDGGYTPWLARDSYDLYRSSRDFYSKLQLATDMKLFFNPSTSKTVIVKTVQDGEVFRNAGDNGDWKSLTIKTEMQLQRLRNWKKDSYEFLDFYDEIQDLLEAKYGLHRDLMTYKFSISGFQFYGRYTSNECGEPFLEVHAKLPRHILKDILFEIQQESIQVTIIDWED